MVGRIMGAILKGIMYLCILVISLIIGLTVVVFKVGFSIVRGGLS